MLFLELHQLLKREKIPYALVGGFAVSLHGVVRGTVDVDIVLPHKEDVFVRFEAVLKKAHYASRLPVNAQEVFQFRQEYIERRNLVAWTFIHQQDPSKYIDVVLTHNLDKMKVEYVQFQKEKIPLVALEDLIAMKKQSGRMQDLEDIKALEYVRKIK